MPLSQADQERYTQALRQHARHPVQLELDLTTLAVIIGALQLALRHPGYPPASRQHLEDWLAQTITAVGTLSADLAAGLRAGSAPAPAVPRHPPVGPTPSLEIRILPTDQLTPLDGALCRVWQGTTDAGVPCLVFVHHVAVAEGQDSAAFERTLQAEVPPGRVVDLRQVR
jgi:hypothetical protein